MKIVLDTNVFVSGVFWSGPPLKILTLWEAGVIDFVVTQGIFAEYERVGYALYKKYPTDKFFVLLERVGQHATVFADSSIAAPVSRDPDDDKFIACALAANVSVIVSGDRDLLDVSGYAGIDILPPVAFLKKYVL